MSLKLVADNSKPKTWNPDPKDPELWLHAPSGAWYVRKQKKGKKPLFKSTGQTGRGKARTEATRIIAQWLGASGGSFEGNSILFSEYAPIALSDFLKSDRYKERTKDNYREWIPRLIQEIGYAKLSDINEVFIENWINDLKTRSKRTTFRDFVSYTTKVLTHAKRSGILTASPKFENPDPKKPTGRLYARAEMEALIGLAEKDLTLARSGENRQTLRRRLNTLAQLRLGFNQFMRLREFLVAPWAEINLETGKWTIPGERIKTGKPKEIYLDPVKVLPLLVEIRSLQNTECLWLFPNPKDVSRPVWDNKSAWVSLKARAGITGKARWHDLRHTALTWALLGDDKFQAELKASCPQCQERMKKQRLVNPMIISKYSGTNIRTIESTYLKVKAEHTREAATCIDL